MCALIYYPPHPTHTHAHTDETFATGCDYFLNGLQLQHEASVSMQFWDNPTVDGFNGLLMTPKPMIRTSDHVFQYGSPKVSLQNPYMLPNVHFPSLICVFLLILTRRLCELVKLQSSCKKLNLLNELMDHSGNYVHTALPYLLSLLQRGLGKRIHLLTHSLTPDPEVDPVHNPGVVRARFTVASFR